jgi:sec-independent protein translocase protein TatA
MGKLFDNPTILLILIVAVILIFGSKRLPDAARGVGRSLRILKAETKGLMTDDDQPTQQVQQPAAQPTQVVQPAAPQPVVQPAPAPAPVAQPVPQPVAEQPVVQPAPQPTAPEQQQG